MKKRMKKSILAVCLIASALGSGIVASAATQVTVGNNGVWTYGDEAINGQVYKFSDYNNPDYVWYTASVGDKKGKRLVRDVVKNSNRNAHARYLKSLGGKTVFYNHGNGAVPK